MQMNAGNGPTGAASRVPNWVPQGALHYIAHTENGQPIRALARAAGCHASTVLRQIRKVEMRRDDPLIDGALRDLGLARTGQGDAPDAACAAEREAGAAPIPDDDTLTREAMRILQRLSEKGAVLAVARDLEKAVVVRDVQGGGTARTAVVDTSVAQAMALKDWITPLSAGRVTRYQMTATGRTALTEFQAQFDLPTATATGTDAERIYGGGCADDGGRSRYGMGETPLSALARRRDRSGKPFLAEVLVQAGERLREDFELAEMDRAEALDWDHFLAMGAKGADNAAVAKGTGPSAARARVQAALQNLGPGLSEVALHCCCYLEGLEVTEKRLGWSARSGKIVLRIALMRLRRHYEETRGGVLIG